MTLQLYHRLHCQYSKRVRDHIDEHKLNDKIEYIEIGEDRPLPGTLPGDRWPADAGKWRHRAMAADELRRQRQGRTCLVH